MIETNSTNTISPQNKFEPASNVMPKSNNPINYLSAVDTQASKLNEESKKEKDPNNTAVAEADKQLTITSGELE